ncbi:hypothetical protein [Thermoactinospora rubra]|uniref:hypothetical protein n=1 Tax=Thermoactinospora rubra TaxID=1088767 RepID=UPI000A0FB97C|nr:hypothetical protein [Thermoactinospora rubra]
MALIIAGLYATAVAVTAVVSVVLGDVRPVWIALTGYAEDFGVDRGSPTPLIVTLALVWVANTWMLWQVLRGPVSGPVTRDRRVAWLRRAIYLNVAYDVILWWPAELLPDDLYDVVGVLVWAPVVLLFPRVLGDHPAWRRTALTLAGLISVAGSALIVALDVMDVGYRTAPVGSGAAVVALAAVAWHVLLLGSQRRDGRWSLGTVLIGLLGLVLIWVWPIGGSLLDLDIEALELLGELDVFFTVWLARSAHELATPWQAATAPARPYRGARWLMAAGALLLLLGLVQAEESARQTFNRWNDECPAWAFGETRYGDTRPEDREKAFLCKVSTDAFGVPQLLPDTLSDQAVLSYGRALCRTTNEKAREALLREAGSERSTWSVEDNVLVFLCPEVVARRRPELLRSESEARQAERDHIAEANARCADPWPRVRARREGTAAYFTVEVGSYAVYDPEGTAEADWEKAFPARGLAGSSGGVVGVYAYEASTICLTVKAFGSAPPLRLKGWEDVVEVGVVSRSGRLEVPSMTEGAEEGAGRPLPDLAVAGPGRYRVRVYARARSSYEEHLVVVYPGRSAKRVGYRSEAASR